MFANISFNNQPQNVFARSLTLWFSPVRKVDIRNKYRNSEVFDLRLTLQSLSLADLQKPNYRPSEGDQSANGSVTKIVSSRSGLVESNVTGASTNSSTRLMYLIACAGKSAHDFAPLVDPSHPAIVS